MRLLDAGKQTSLNVKGAYLEVWSDMLDSLGVIAAAIVIWLTGGPGSMPWLPLALASACCRGYGAC